MKYSCTQKQMLTGKISIFKIIYFSKTHEKKKREGHLSLVKLTEAVLTFSKNCHWKFGQPTYMWCRHFSGVRDYLWDLCLQVLIATELFRSCCFSAVSPWTPARRMHYAPSTQLHIVSRIRKRISMCLDPASSPWCSYHRAWLANFMRRSADAAAAVDSDSFRRSAGTDIW